MGLDEELDAMESGFETDSELAEEENSFEDEYEYEDDELGPNTMETDLEEDFEDFDEEDDEDEDEEYDEEDEEGLDEEEYDEDEEYEDEDDEYDIGITKEGVAEATNDFNTIYKEGAAAAKELKDAFDDIKSAFDLGGFFKK